MEIEQILREFRQGVEKLYGKRLKSVIPYGPYARKQAISDSDIDLAVVLAGDVAAGKEIDRMTDAITEGNLSYGVLISVYPVSEKDYNSVNSPTILNLRRQGVPI